MTGHRVISDKGVVSKTALDTSWVSASGVSIDSINGWCWWWWTVHSWCGSQILPSPLVVDEQLGFSWGLTTKTRHILRFQGGSGGLAIWGKLFPLGSTGDKVSQSWEVFTRTCWRGRSYWLILTGFILLCWDLHFCLDIVSTSMISIIRPVAANVPHWVTSKHSSDFGFQSQTRHHIFHAFSATEKTRAESLRSLFA